LSKRARSLKIKQHLQVRTLSEACERFDYALHVRSHPQAAAKPDQTLKNIQLAYDQMNACLKENIAFYKIVANDGSPFAAACSVFINHLEAMRKGGKMAVDQSAQVLGKLKTAGEKLRFEMRTCYLGMKKGVEETEAAMKLLKAKPTLDNVKKAFCSSHNTRSISMAVTTWKQKILPLNPALVHELPDDPVHLVEAIDEAVQNKGMTFWEQKLKTSTGGWEERARHEADAYLHQMPRWRALANRIKELSA